MAVSDLLEQAKALSPAECKELTKQLIDMIDLPTTSPANEPEEHWGISLNKLLNEIGPIELKYPEIEDSVEWVKHLRAEQHRHRLGDWGNDE